jgi:hydrogenase maturation protein HypF
MVPDLDAARALAVVDEREAALLASPARPIVLVRRRIDDQLATAAVSVSALVAPGNPLVGVMLPYTPLHHLIFRPVPGRPSAVPRAIVLTSGNLTDEPICIDDDDAHTRLAALADAFLTHDRPIHVPCDDSVVRVVDGVEQPVRRSRGYAPLPVTLPVEVAPVLAVGGELKNTFCVASGRHAWMSQHIGDMENLETLAAFARSTEQFSAMYAIAPAVLAADRHPGYLTRRWAHDHAEGRPVVEVQHHHAHVAALMAEHGLDGSAPIVGVAFDGTGYGTQASGAASIWGGEVLVADYDGFERVANLRELPLPGGDAAVRNPCRIALAYLVACGIDPSAGLPAVAACDETERRVIPQQVARGAGIVPTSSMGRLFDAVASLLGVRHRISYEAQAAIELEVLATSCPADRAVPLAFAAAADGTIDAAPLLRVLVDGVRSGVDRAALARGFHDGVVAVVVEIARRERARRGLRVVGLTGGVFQNALLTSLTRAVLEADGFDVLIHRLVPANDGGLALGQAIVAGRRKD